ncbi:MAG: KamA family radical SAM protein [Spirochaetota bacterium]
MQEKMTIPKNSSLNQKNQKVNKRASSAPCLASSAQKALETIPSEEDGEPPPGFIISENINITKILKDPEEAEPPGKSGVNTECSINIPGKDHLPVETLVARQPDIGLLKQKTYALIGASKNSDIFRSRYFPWSTRTEWDDWKWQLKNRITNIAQLERLINLSEDEREALTSGNGSFPFAITPYYASLLDRDDPLHPIRRCVVPVTTEQKRTFGESDDPLGEESQSPVSGLVHRYPDRVLFLVTTACSVYCRYCTRSRIVGNHERQPFYSEHWAQALEYIARNPAIRDVLISGGDPLTLSNEKLEYLLASVRRIPHVELLRIGTKVPVVLPQRITLSLVKMLKKYHPLWMSIHFTHPEEITPEVAEATGRLADAGIPLGSQTVLLKGINDSVQTMTALVHGLLKIRVRPYYLYQCDPINGSSHFRTTVEKGIEIIRGLRGHTSGYAVPQYVIDAPGGGGKVPINPQYVIGREGDFLALQNYEGLTFRYPDPGDQLNPEQLNTGYETPGREHIHLQTRLKEVIV